MSSFIDFTPERVPTTIRMDRELRDVLELIGKTQGRPINALVNEAISAFVDREAPALEQDLSETLELFRAYRRRHSDHRAAIEAIVAAEGAYPDPAEADRIFQVNARGVERKVLDILDDEA